MMDIEEDGTGPGSYPRQKYSPSKSPSDISTHLVDPVEQGTVYELEETCSSGNSGKDKNVNRRCKWAVYDGPMCLFQTNEKRDDIV